MPGSRLYVWLASRHLSACIVIWKPWWSSIISSWHFGISVPMYWLYLCMWLKPDSCWTPLGDGMRMSYRLYFESKTILAADQQINWALRRKHWQKPAGPRKPLYEGVHGGGLLRFDWDLGLLFGPRFKVWSKSDSRIDIQNMQYILYMKLTFCQHLCKGHFIDYN